MSTERSIHLAVALDGPGWHPAAWRLAHPHSNSVFGARYWTELIQEAERGLLDLATIEDRLAPTRATDGEQQGSFTGALDASLIAARVAPATDRIGLVPTVIATHTEPFHVSKSIATLDHISRGRAGVRVRASYDPREFANVGRRPAPSWPNPSDAEPFGEVVDHIEVVRRLWDSWEDDAEIRDAATGRFIDRDRLHYIDFEGSQFSVRGPSITPRPPQGQPPVAVLAHQEDGFRLAAGSADLVCVTPQDGPDAARIVDLIGAEVAAADRDDQVRVFADLVVVLDETTRAAQARLDQLDELSVGEFDSDATVFVGTPADLQELIGSWSASGIDGFRLRPAVSGVDLRQITRRLVPELQRAGRFRTAYDSSTLRGHLGLARPDNRYAAA